MRSVERTIMVLIWNNPMRGKAADRTEIWQLSLARILGRILKIHDFLLTGGFGFD
jgi:hypothetical protein